MKDIYYSIYTLIRKNRYLDALKDLLSEEMEKINPPFDQDLNHAWYLVGDIFYQLQRYDDAIIAFKKALDEWDSDVDAILALSNAYSSNLMPRNSEGILRRGLEIDPDNEKFKYNFGNSLFDQNRFDDAIECYREIKSDNELAKMARSNIRKSLKNKKIKK